MNILKELNNKKKELNYDLSLFREYIGNNIEKYANIENPCGFTEGIYFIEDFYIGKSSDLIKRLSSHLADSTTTEMANTVGTSLNYEKVYKLKKVLKHRKLNVTILDDDCNKETEYIDGFYLSNPLVNKLGVSSSKKFIKEDLILRYIDGSRELCERLVSGLFIATITVEYPFKMELMARGKDEVEAILKLRNRIGSHKLKNK